MLNIRKVHLMARLAIFEREEGRDVLNQSRYFKGDYVMNQVMLTLLYYTLCFLLISAIFLLTRIEGILQNLNIEYIQEIFSTLFVFYLSGLVIASSITALCMAFRYDVLSGLRGFYEEKLEKLLLMEEGKALPDEEYSDDFNYEVKRLKNPLDFFFFSPDAELSDYSEDERSDDGSSHGVKFENQRSESNADFPDSSVPRERQKIDSASYYMDIDARDTRRKKALRRPGNGTLSLSNASNAYNTNNNKRALPLTEGRGSRPVSSNALDVNTSAVSNRRPSSERTLRPNSYNNGNSADRRISTRNTSYGEERDLLKGLTDIRKSQRLSEKVMKAAESYIPGRGNSPGSSNRRTELPHTEGRGSRQTLYKGPRAYRNSGSSGKAASSYDPIRDKVLKDETIRYAKREASRYLKDGRRTPARDEAEGT